MDSYWSEIDKYKMFMVQGATSATVLNNLIVMCSPCYIVDLFKDLETNKAQAKLDEIEAIGFGFLKLVPKWHVKQGIMVMLAKAYDIEMSTLKLDHGNIRIGLELFQRVFGILPGVDDFPPFNGMNAAHVSIKKKISPVENYTAEVFCQPDGVQEAFHPALAENISVSDLLDVSDPGSYHWPLHIFKLLEQAIRKYKHKQNKSYEGCMFVLLVLYFQKLKHGELENCLEPVSWLSAWTTEELSAMAEIVQPEDCNEPGGNNGGVMEGAAREDTIDVSPEREDADHTIRPMGCTKGLCACCD
ncbi:hypothetical protein Ahy_A07g034429 [Arachis hypogaea]|uniref:Uncharacterized protein n=1 Tax=Arachis hypogaea TaxID=3818 RepID=A0A445CBU0_ARAHY|nr:hypothetical protein Ahy_A07g034429 [Arachis hypogaea]